MENFCEENFQSVVFFFVHDGSKKMSKSSIVTASVHFCDMFLQLILMSCCDLPPSVLQPLLLWVEARC